MEGGEGEVKQYMDDKLYAAAREGDEDCLGEIQVSSPESESGDVTQDEHRFLMLTPEGDNVLHLAASADHLRFITKAVEKFPSLVMLICWKNSLEETPLHVAARLGHVEIVRLLVSSYRSHLEKAKQGKVRSTLLSLMVAEAGKGNPEPWMAQDSRGNTPVHEALKNGCEEIAAYLLEVEPKLGGCDNDADESVLYLAAVYGHEKVIEMILNSDVSYSLNAPAGLTPLHVATDICSENTTKLLLEKHSDMAKKADNHKKTALHYAAEANKHGHVEAILKVDRSSAYLRDENGLTPLLRAASLGQLQAVNAILGYCPHSVAITDDNGRTALHFVDVTNYEDGINLFKNSSLSKFINEVDVEGNTPLHLAVDKSEHVKAKVLLANDSTMLTLRNEKGFTAWDIIKSKPELSEEMVEIGYQLATHTSQKHIQNEHQPQLIQQATNFQQDSNHMHEQKLNTLGLIATVLAAVTFAAGIIVPGGFDISGHAILTRKTDFKVFILSNTIAMCGYTCVLFSTLWAMTITRRDDEPRFLLTFSIHILQLSFYASLTAFMSSAYALISAKSLWVAIVVVSLPPCIVVLTISKSVVFQFARLFCRFLSF